MSFVLPGNARSLRFSDEPVEIEEIEEIELEPIEIEPVEEPDAATVDVKVALGKPRVRRYTGPKPRKSTLNRAIYGIQTTTKPYRGAPAPSAQDDDFDEQATMSLDRETHGVPMSAQTAPHIPRAPRMPIFLNPLVQGRDGPTVARPRAPMPSSPTSASGELSLAKMLATPYALWAAAGVVVAVVSFFVTPALFTKLETSRRAHVTQQR